MKEDHLIFDEKILLRQEGDHLVKENCDSDNQKNYCPGFTSPKIPKLPGENIPSVAAFAFALSECPESEVDTIQLSEFKAIDAAV